MLFRSKENNDIIKVPASKFDGSLKKELKLDYAPNDENCRIKRSEKSLWGVRIFDASETAVERRSYRSNRRRLQRRKERMKLLRNVFAEEIYNVDHDFFARLDNSFFMNEDKEGVSVLNNNANGHNGFLNNCLKMG